jgi:cyclic beta-1,2-glucan synthetase
LLLQERVPAVAPLVEPPPESQAINVLIPRSENELVSRRLKGYETATPRTHLLSNGHYAVMLTSTGAGYSQYRDMQVTRWRSDATRDHWGQFLYLRDVHSGRTWSAAYQPTQAKPDSYHVTYSIDKAEFHRHDGLIETSLEVTVSPEHQAELRHLKISNHGARPVELEVTSYAEVVLTSPGADLAHPAFQKLFVETEYVAEETALLAKRRPRDAEDPAWWAVHVLAPGPNSQGSVEYETSREEFVGRGRSLAAPSALSPGKSLTGSIGAVLDPIFSLRCRITIAPHETANLAFTTAVAASREEALTLADAYHDLRGVLRGFELAWAFNQVQLRHLRISPAKAHLFQRLASALLYPDPTRRAEPAVLLANRQGQSALWRYGISGDVPILLAHISKPEQLDTVRDLLTAQHYWREHRLVVDVVLLNDNPGSYLDALQEQLVTLVNEVYHQPGEKPANVALLRGAQIPPEDQILLETAASFVVHCGRGSLAKQLEPASAGGAKAAAKPPAWKPPPPELRTAPVNNHPHVITTASEKEASRPGLTFSNGFGGFANEGREYQITITDQRRPRKPWSNVLANPEFGCLVTESGGGYTWAANSREFKLTTWANDALLDPPSEWLYLRDERSQELLRPLPQAVATNQKYRVTHGQGYSQFEVSFPGLASETTIFVADDDPLKFVRVRLKNTGAEPRLLSATYYAEWVLGVAREQTQLHLVTSWDALSETLLCQNRYHPELGDYIAFLHVSGGETNWTGDRSEFIGRNGNLEEPAALQRPALSGKTGPGLDPCGVVQARFSIPARGEHELVFLIGAASSLQDIRELVSRNRDPASSQQVLQRVQDGWSQRLGAIQVRTPNAALDTLVNHWLLYQTIGCRLWARSAFYQSGGAYGFRDQLQDVMAVVYTHPELAREQILRAAAHQFEAGDVQHWWHPPLNRGTRTRFSDDYLWLTFVTSHYVSVTGDLGILDETAPFLHSPPLEPHEQERYETPQQSPEVGSLYEHCRRTLARAFRLGPHGLPLMGCGDWNDGMNKVGELGQGESVWVGWFLLVILRDFLPLMRQRGDIAQADEWAMQAQALRHSLESEAWDGGWYRRAYFDDGTPLGSSQNDECQIDSIAQTWAVFAGADADRSRQGMEAVWERLVRVRDGLVLLFAPAFDQTKLDPGYIKGYLPGIRENGGQYTHPALWVIQAFAQLGDAERALEVFDLINPIHHSSTPAEAARYQVEPYVVAADVYGVAPHIGRGGWTWYTGSAAWMYRVAIESLLGLRIRGNRLGIQPCVPASWHEFEITYRWKSATYRITVIRPGVNRSSAPTILLDGAPIVGSELVLVDDRQNHHVIIGSVADIAEAAPALVEGGDSPIAGQA